LHKLVWVGCEGRVIAEVKSVVTAGIQIEDANVLAVLRDGARPRSSRATADVIRIWHHNDTAATGSKPLPPSGVPLPGPWHGNRRDSHPGGRHGIGLAFHHEQDRPRDVRGIGPEIPGHAFDRKRLRRAGRPREVTDASECHPPVAVRLSANLA
jgi:hypothetical protein